MQKSYLKQITLLILSRIRLLLGSVQRCFSKFFHQFFKFQRNLTSASSCSFVAILDLSFRIFVERCSKSSYFFYQFFHDSKYYCVIKMMAKIHPFLK